MMMPHRSHLALIDFPREQVTNMPAAQAAAYRFCALKMRIGILDGENADVVHGHVAFPIAIAQILATTLWSASALGTVFGRFDCRHQI
jgi:hypothetical protein